MVLSHLPLSISTPNQVLDRLMPLLEAAEAQEDATPATPHSLPASPTKGAMQQLRSSSFRLVGSSPGTLAGAAPESPFAADAVQGARAFREDAPAAGAGGEGQEL